MLSKIRNILNLLRVRQYYKNGLIFVGAFFSGKLIDPSLWYLLIIGFIILCCASSFNYIINDIRDIEKDKKHIEKLEKRPLASGDLSILFAVVLLAILVAIISGLIITIIFPNWNFIIMVLLIIITGQLYNHLFKKFAFIDILSLSLIYLWRALAGCFLIEVFISPWLFLAIFEIALFLVIAKRKGDLILIGEEKAAKHKKSYDKYSQKLLDQFHIIIAGALFITYSLYLMIHFDLFSAENVNLHEYITILTIPLSLYIIMRYMYLTSARPEIARSTEKALLDPGIVIAGILLLGILTYSFYLGAFIRLLNL
ncbi:MAG: UbiA prenyltransferase family protein [Candidatus Thorarchaeota archaeon]